MKRSPLVALALVLPLMMAGCTPTASPDSSSHDMTPESAASAGAQALSPTIVSPGELATREATVVVATELVIAAPDGTEADWTGTTADPTIAEFSAGGASEGAVFRPGFEARKVGKTAATLTGPDGQTISFTISVVAP
ncbi:hypothetical protein [Microbacterium trichothecenolyticum]|uniref:Bacterial Ig domain-containing protein n=1 Tax=Microbacterium trichothecenolyticum TaxID=69370 RepID=A0ABU0TQF7_MICTR|nr:hypothetical protein [Microbacterium trichothecenolyticum]MDQ1121900.1 hypothetical protein [Microbacterium trichothecenolyticum]